MKTGEAIKRKSIWADCGAVAIMIAVFIGFFFKTIFKGEAVSKLGLIQNVDTFFNSNLKQAIIPLTCDPSGFLIFFPNGHFAWQSWLRLCPPLWNPLSACGYPILGDPQSFIFSPAVFLGLFSTAQAYNVGLLMEIFLNILGVYFLARLLGLSIYAAVLAAFAYGFCPHMLSTVDLSGAECVIPWVMSAFVCLAKKPGFFSVLIAALASTLAMMMAHPEVAFFAVLYGALFGFVLRLAERSFRPREIFKAFVEFLATGLFVLALSSPLLLPFVEYMELGYFYKNTGHISRVPPGEFLLSVCNACGENPYYLGFVLIAMIPLIFLVRNAVAKAILISAAIFGLISLPGDWLLPLLSQKPISYIATLYGLPELLLLICLAGALVLDRFLNRDFKRRHLLMMVVSAVIIILLPGLLGLDPANLGKRYFPISVITASLAVLILWLFLTFKQIPVWLCAVPIIVLNFISESDFSKKALPTTAAYRIETTKALEFLQDSGGRSVFIGSNFFLPNQHMIYGIANLGCFNPIVPKLYRDFILKCGAKCHNLYFYDFPERCSDLLDLASIKFVVTGTAICGEQKEIGIENLVPAVPRRVAPGLRILSASQIFDPINSQIEGNLKLRVHDLAISRYAIQWCILDERDLVLWSGREKLLDSLELTAHQMDQYFCIPVPLSILRSSKIRYGFRVIDTWTGTSLAPDGKLVPNCGDICVLGECSLDGNKVLDRDADRHFQLAKEFSNGVRIYRNLRALPQAYLVTKVRYVAGENESLSIVDSADFDPRAEGVVFGTKNTVEYLATKRAGPLSLPMVSRPDPLTVVVDVVSPEPSLLILTDSYYPGWSCLINGNQKPILRANHMFRGVKLKGGRSHVVFQYQPQSFSLGWLIAVIVFVASLFVNFVYMRLKSGKTAP